jgi:hypothetical protein
VGCPAVASHGAAEVGFGVVVGGRDIPVEGAVDTAGDFLNTVPLRIAVDLNLPSDEWLQRIHQSSMRALDHLHLPLGDMCRHSDGAWILETGLMFETFADRLDPAAFGYWSCARSMVEFSDIH